MNKYFTLVVACLLCISLNATNDENSELEVQANEGMYFQGRQESTNSITAYLVADEPLTITCFILLSGQNRSASYNIGGKTFYLRTDSNIGEVREEITVSLPKGQNWVTITNNNRQRSTAVINLVGINGQPSSTSQLILGASGW